MPKNTLFSSLTGGFHVMIDFILAYYHLEIPRGVHDPQCSEGRRLPRSVINVTSSAQ